MWQVSGCLHWACGGMAAAMKIHEESGQGFNSCRQNRVYAPGCMPLLKWLIIDFIMFIHECISRSHFSFRQAKEFFDMLCGDRLMDEEAIEECLQLRLE